MIILELCPSLCSAEGGPELSWLLAMEKANLIFLHKKVENYFFLLRSCWQKQNGVRWNQEIGV